MALSPRHEKGSRRSCGRRSSINEVLLEEINPASSDGMYYLLSMKGFRVLLRPV